MYLLMNAYNLILREKKAKIINNPSILHLCLPKIGPHKSVVRINTKVAAGIFNI